MNGGSSQTSSGISCQIRLSPLIEKMQTIWKAADTSEGMLRFMKHFIIDGFDFGVDGGRSSLEIHDSTFDLKLVGDESLINDLMQQDDHPWGWLIQPPFLYVLGLPCQVDPNGDLVHDITEQDLDDYDIALYVMEHHDVLPCRITKKGDIVTVSGQVHGIRKSPLDFSGEFSM
jgi:hypothetical protein